MKTINLLILNIVLCKCLQHSKAQVLIHIAEIKLPKRAETGQLFLIKIQTKNNIQTLKLGVR